MMRFFEIVAHRGIADGVPENTLSAYERAIELGADAIECDVRLTADGVPIIYHYYYLEELTSLEGPVFNYPVEEIQNAHFKDLQDSMKEFKIPTLVEVLESISGRIGLEIEIKGPEPESVEIIASVLNKYKKYWDTIEVTSHDPALLLDFKRYCPEVAIDLLYPRSAEWMRLDVVTYDAVHRARLAGARAVHLHPSQLSKIVVDTIHDFGILIHAWDVNTEQDLQPIVELGIPRIDTDQFSRIRLFVANQLS